MDQGWVRITETTCKGRGRGGGAFLNPLSLRLRFAHSSPASDFEKNSLEKISLDSWCCKVVSFFFHRNLENTERPVYSVKGHSQIINCIEGIGGLGIGVGAPEIVTGSRDGESPASTDPDPL